MEEGEEYKTETRELDALEHAQRGMAGMPVNYVRAMAWALLSIAEDLRRMRELLERQEVRDEMDPPEPWWRTWVVEAGGEAG